MFQANRSPRRFALAGVAFVFAFASLQTGLSQPPGKGKGRTDPTFAADQAVFQFLLDNRKEIRRTVKTISNGVETVTESDKPDVVTQIQGHLDAMHKRVKEGKGIHLRDPLFAELFKNYDKITMTIEKVEKGVKVKETSDDPKVAKLIQAHAAVVTKFIENGHEEMRKNHALPTEPETKSGEVSWIGEMRAVMQDGNLKGNADLTKFATEKNFYAVGPLEGLRGEVTVVNGIAYISRVSDGNPAVTSSFKEKACFLVFAKVPSWREFPLPDGVRKADLETWIKKTATSAGVESDRPFPFLMRGNVESATLHIVSKTDDSPHSMEQHDQIKKVFELKQRPVEIVGFYSEHHAGVFTHHDSFVHMHVVSTDHKVSGHLDKLEPGKGMVLLLPTKNRD